MNDDALQELTGPEQRLAAARSRAYRLFAEAFEYADEPTLEAIRAGQLAEALRNTLGAVEERLLAQADWEALADAGDGDALAVEYTRLFDVGPSGPPCPLYGGLYGGARMKTMEEAVRFYNHFGLTLSEKPRELPDHLTTQLEFLHYLTYRETETLQHGGDPDLFRRAQRDFVERHPGRWVPKLRERLERQSPMRFFLELTRQLGRFLENDRERLIQQVGPAPVSGPASRTRARPSRSSADPVEPERRDVP